MGEAEQLLEAEVVLACPEGARSCLELHLLVGAELWRAADQNPLVCQGGFLGNQAGGLEGASV